MFGIGPWELIVVFAIVLLLFGGKRLPGIATGLGSAIKNFKSAVKEPLQEEKPTLLSSAAQTSDKRPEIKS